MMNSRFSGSSGLGSWSGKFPSGFQLLEQRPDHRPGHPVAAVDDHAQRLDGARVDDLKRVLVEVVEELDLLDAPATGGLAQTGRDLVLDIPDARVAGEGKSAPTHQLRTGVLLGVVRGRTHEAAIEIARAHQVVEHLGADLAGVEDGGALRAHPISVGLGELGRSEAHVAPEPEPELRRRFVLELADHAGERAADEPGGVEVDVVAIDAADVVGLEDSRVDRHGRVILSSRG
jgi:hypothetical protein